MAEFLTIGDAARITGYSIKTLRRWSDTDKLPVRRSPSNQRMFRREDLNALPKRAAQELSDQTPSVT